jgi:hypothetical protein
MSEKRNKNKKGYKKKFSNMELFIESDQHIAFIVGYTSNGVPYGLTQKEWNKINLETSENSEKNSN